MIGWKCPGCGRCWGPSVQGCSLCNDGGKTIAPQKLTPMLPPVFHPHAPRWPGSGTTDPLPTMPTTICISPGNTH